MPEDNTRSRPSPALLIASLAFATGITALRPVRPRSSAEQEAIDAQQRAIDAVLARDRLKQRDNDDRVAERAAQDARPEVRAEWLEIAVDRVTAARETGAFELRSLGPTAFRGVAPRALLDPATGDEVQVRGGDAADRFAYGCVRVGRHGAEQRFGFRWSYPEPGHPTILYLDGEVDAAGLRVAARLFNAEPAFWTSTPGSIVLQQQKQRFFGPNGLRRFADEKRGFLDAKVDAAFRARGIDPDHGRQHDRDKARP